MHISTGITDQIGQFQGTMRSRAFSPKRCIYVFIAPWRVKLQNVYVFELEVCPFSLWIAIIVGQTRIPHPWQKTRFLWPWLRSLKSHLCSTRSSGIIKTTTTADVNRYDNSKIPVVCVNSATKVMQWLSSNDVRASGSPMNKGCALNFPFSVGKIIGTHSAQFRTERTEKKNSSLVCQDPLTFAGEWYIM